MNAAPAITLAAPKLTRRERTIRGFWIGLAVTIALLLMWILNLFEGTQLRLSNIYFVSNQRSDQTVLVAIDDASLQAYGRSPVQWDRSLYARLLDQISAAGARVVAFDLLFSEPSPDDALFAEAIQMARTSEARTRVILPIAGVGNVQTDEIASPQSDSTFFPSLRFDNLLRPVDPLNASAEYLAAVNTLPDVDGIIRHQSSIIQINETPILSFSLATYLAYLRIPAAAVWQVVSYQDGLLNVTPESQIHVDNGGLWLQNYFGAPAQSFPTYSLQAVLNGEVAPEVFNDKIVMVGLVSAQGATDTYFVPSGITGWQMAGVEVQAHAVETLLRGTALREQTQFEQFLSIVFTTLIASLIFAQMRWQFKLLLTVFFVLLLIVIGSVYFSVYGIVIYLLYPMLGVVLPAVIEIGSEINIEINSRRQTEFLLEKVAALYTETQRQKQLLEATLKGSPAGIVIVDGAARFVQANDIFHQNLIHHEDDLTGESATRLGASLAGITLFDGLSQAGADANGVETLQHRFARRQAFRHELKINTMTYNVYATLLPGYDLWVMVFSDVTALAELSRLKTQMIRMASHDLKNPLGTVMGYVSLMMMDEELLTDDHKRYLGIVQRSSETMVNIINDILNLEQLRSTEMPNEQVSLAQLVYDVTSRHEPEMTAKHQPFNLNIQPGLPIIIGRPTQLAQVISNLLSNAIKYTPNDGRIGLRLYQANPNTLRLEVQDTGYGISKEAQKKLFTEFYRVRTPDTANIPGTGLGLSLVKSVIEAHGGRIWVESEPKVGSTFFVELPVKVDEPSTMLL